jgi:tetratricopeptide (TPR) repeat protein
MLKSLRFVALVVAFSSIGFAQTANSTEARKIAEQATQRAREGKGDEALSLYRNALALAPDDTSILRDYAVVLGWNEKYSQAIPIIRTILASDNNQPDWALREFARSFLFGDATNDALRCLEQLVERGDHTEETLSRRALALRWSGRSDDAELAYRDLLRRSPQSAAAYQGLAYVSADRGRPDEGLRILDSAPVALQNRDEIFVARIQILNWMGRHYEAQRLIARVRPELANSRELLRESVSASRWGGDPSGAMHDLLRLVSLYPDRRSQDLLSQLRTEYGHSVAPSFRLSQDSDGLIDRTASSEAMFHLKPAHAIRAAYQYRWLQQAPLGERTLVRYDLGWSGALTSRLVAYTTISNVDYRTPGLPRKIVGDASVSVAASDTLRFGGGGGKIVMDAFQSINPQVTATFGFAEFGVNLGRNRIQSRYSRYAFSDDVNRSRVDVQFMRPILTESAARMSLGFRSNIMTHSAWTPHFYSPSRLQSYFGVGQIGGRITSWMDYGAEAAAGWQSEEGTPLMHPFQATGTLAWHPSRHWRLVVDAAKSTASMDRIGPGLQTYSRWSTSATIEVHLP